MGTSLSKPVIAWKLLTTIDNWPLYAADKFGWMHRPYLLRSGGLVCRVRPQCTDRWAVIENMVLDQYHLSTWQGEHFDTIVDLGAHIGTFTLQAARLFPRARILAIEPYPESFDFLIQNVALNALQARVTTRRAAVTAGSAPTATLFLGAHGGLHTTTVPLPLSLEVPNLSLPDLLPMVHGRALLKMDIEGAETAILEKYEDHLVHTFSLILIERHAGALTKPRSALTPPRLEGAEIEVIADGKRSYLPHPYPKHGLPAPLQPSNT